MWINCCLWDTTTCWPIDGGIRSFQRLIEWPDGTCHSSPNQKGQENQPAANFESKGPAIWFTPDTPSSSMGATCPLWIELFLWLLQQQHFRACYHQVVPPGRTKKTLQECAVSRRSPVWGAQLSKSEKQMEICHLFSSGSDVSWRGTIGNWGNKGPFTRSTWRQNGQQKQVIMGFSPLNYSKNHIGPTFRYRLFWWTGTWWAVLHWKWFKIKSDKRGISESNFDVWWKADAI